MASEDNTSGIFEDLLGMVDRPASDGKVLRQPS